MTIACRRWMSLVTVSLTAAACLAILGRIGARAQAPRDVTIRAATHAHAIPADRGAAAVWQSLKKLDTRASLLYFTAHPDDEDGGMLAYESRGQGVRTALVTLNRGEGGQNVMSNDYFDRLGLVRTQELLAAGRYYGVEQYFTSVIDFGFSKTKAQSLRKWGFNRVLRDEVRVVRMVRPLVVASTFVGGPSDGHGNHQVAGEMAQEVYKAAGDPKMFPDQIAAGLLPWSPLKAYARVPVRAVTSKGIHDYADDHDYPVRFFNYITGQWSDGLPSTQVRIPEGTYAPLVGLAYDQISRRGLGEQKTQNGGPSIPLPGPTGTPYHLWASRVATPGSSGGAEASLFEGVDIRLAGIAGLAPSADRAALLPGLEAMQGAVTHAMEQFSAKDPAKIAPLLAQGLKATNALLEQVSASSLPSLAKYNITHELKVKQAQFNDALTQALALSINANVVPAGEPASPFSFGLRPTFQIAIPGQRFDVQIHVANSGSVPVTLASLTLGSVGNHAWTFRPLPATGAAGNGSVAAMPGEHMPSISPIAAGRFPASLDAGQAAALRVAVTVPDDAAFTRPYYSRPDIEQPYYNIDQPRSMSLPNMPYPLAAWAEFQYDGETLQLGKVVQVVREVNGAGIVENPLVTGPAISVTLAQKSGIVPLGTQSFPIGVMVHSNEPGAASGSLHLQLPPGWTATPATQPFTLAATGADLSLNFTVHPSALTEKPYTVTAVAEVGGHDFSEGYVVTGYPGLRPYNYYQKADYRTTGVDVKVAPGLNVAYVVGTGDDVPQALTNLGIHVRFLSPQDIATANLNQYSTIILGVRAYTARPELATYNQRLLDFVNNGGTLIVQYQVGQYDHDFGPYPYVLFTDKNQGVNTDAGSVMDNRSTVELLLPNAGVLNWPNQITAADFQGWVEERGHSFMTSWSPKWEALTEMHDPNQAPQKGGLLLAHYGKGVYIYSALAFYRQLANGVPGAYRIFANLISAGREARRPGRGREARRPGRAQAAAR